MTEAYVKLGDLPPGAMKTIDLGGTETVVANVDGACFAFGGICPHEGGSLGDGELHGFTVICPWHGARFDVRTGAVVDGYSDQPVPTFEVRLEGDMLTIRKP